MKLAYIGYKIQEKYNNGIVRDEDSDLFDFLIQKGIDLQREIWNNPSVNWGDYHAVVIKSPWDYHENHAQFLEWLNQLTQLGVKVFNSAETIAWNSDKHYLKDIATANLPVINTLYLEKNTQIDISRNYFLELGTPKLVIKPCVSAGAKNTVLVTAEELPELIPLINDWLKDEAYMAQPFVEEILTGEWSLLFFGGKYSHSLLKTPKENDFRVQHYLGGTVTYQVADETLIKEASQYIKAFAANTLYARVDGVVIDGVFHLMELELIEPYLFLNNEISHLENYYKALKTMIDYRITN